jgi:hypothetical protein
MMTIVDVLDFALDGDISAQAATKLSKRQTAELAEEVHHFHDTWQAPPLKSNEYRVSLGFLGEERQNVAALGMRSGELSGSASALHLESRRMFANTLVYGDSVVAHDPTSSFGWDATVALFAETIEHIGRLAPLVRCGGLILAPVLTDVHRNAQRRWSSSAIGREALEIIRSPNFDWPDDIPRSEYWEGLAHAAYRTFCIDLEEAFHCGARFLPSDAFTWRYLMASLDYVRDEVRPRKAELKIVPSLVAAQLPLLEGVSIAALTEIREGSDVMSEWRAKLRSAVKHIEEIPFRDRAFAVEARGALADELEPAAAAVRRSMAKSRVIRRVAKEGLASMVLGGAVLGGISVFDGGGQVLGGLVGLTSGSVTNAVIRYLFRPRPEGAAVVLARLVEDMDRRS